MKQYAKICFLVALVLLVTGITALAQSDAGRVIGTVADPTGAAIPGATITIIKVDTNRTVSTQSGATGGYSVNALTPGFYKVQVTKENFRSETANITLEISQVQELNFKLKIGGTGETVNVTDEVPLVDTSTSSAGEVIQGNQVIELPLNGRNFTSLALMTPGVSRGNLNDNAAAPNNNAETWRNAESGGAALAVNGLRPQANNYLIDGIDNNDNMVGSLVIFPAIEDIGEFKTTTSVAPAEFGRSGGGIVQVATKSGTNTYHGSLYWFNRSKVGAAYAFTTNNPQPIELSRNQFGASLGGAIWKDKLFAFVDYQGWRMSLPAGTGATNVPTAKMRTGDFSELLGGSSTATSLPYSGLPGCTAAKSANPTAFNAAKGYVFDPATCLPFGWDSVNHQEGVGMNIIPAARQNSVGVKYLNAFPNQNIASANPQTNANNFSFSQQNIESRDDYDARLDYNISSKDAIFARYSYGQDFLHNTDALVDASHFLPSSNGSNPNHPRQVAVGYTRTINNSIVNEFRYGYSKSFYGYLPPKSGVPMAANLGIANANTAPDLGGMALIGGWEKNLDYVGDYGPYLVKEPGQQLTDSLTWNRGKHTFKFGASIMRRDVNWIQGNRAKGYFFIDDQGSASGLPTPTSGYGTFTGYESSELMAGFMGGYQVGGYGGYYQTRSWEDGIFVQDDFRVSRRLTLNIGLRYDLFTWPTEATNRQSNFDPTTGTLVEAGATDRPLSLMNTPKGNFGPRIGFSYDLRGNGKTVIRGGYGLFYYIDKGGVGAQLGENPDFNGYTGIYACSKTTAGDVTCGNGARVTLSGRAPDGSTDATVAAASGALPPKVGVNPKDLSSLDSVVYWPQHSPDPNIQQWNIQIEQAFGSSTSVTAAYVGTKMENLATGFNANQTVLGGSTKWFPNVGDINEYAMIGRGNYNGLQMKLDRKMGHGLQAMAAYTWSHTLDNSNQPLGNGAGGIMVGEGGVPLLKYEYSSSNSDQRQLFVASAIYELPVGRGKLLGRNMPKALDYLIGGWQWNNVIVLASGTPIDIGGAANGLLSPNVGNGRPDYHGGCKTGVSWDVWMTCPAGAFTRPAGLLGNLGRNYFAGPGTHSWDTLVSKTISVTERVKTEFRAQAYNLTNTPHFTNPNSGVSSTGATSGNFGKNMSVWANTNRELELALRVSF
jgi:hypothetical protein